MTTVEDIEHAAERLPLPDFDRLAAWVSERYHQLWKQQLDEDSAAGKLDSLFEEAAAERQAGSLRDWPADKE